VAVKLVSSAEFDKKAVRQCMLDWKLTYTGVLTKFISISIKVEVQKGNLALSSRSCLVLRMQLCNVSEAGG